MESWSSPRRSHQVDGTRHRGHGLYPMYHHSIEREVGNRPMLGYQQPATEFLPTQARIVPNQLRGTHQQAKADGRLLVEEFDRSLDALRSVATPASRRVGLDAPNSTDLHRLPIVARRPQH